MILKVVCEICGEVIAEVDTGFLSFPMTGAMFKSPDTHHQVPDPFDSRQTWEDFRCPFGRSHRPMIKPNALLLMSATGQKQLIELPEDGTPPRIVAKPISISEWEQQKDTEVPTPGGGSSVSGTDAEETTSPSAIADDELNKTTLDYLGDEMTPESVGKDTKKKTEALKSAKVIDGGKKIRTPIDKKSNKKGKKK
jgi:hypothetical protein